MNEKLSMAKELLAKYGQEHLLQCYDKLSDAQKNKLLIKKNRQNYFDKILEKI